MALNFHLRTIKQAYIGGKQGGLTINKLEAEQSLSGNPRNFHFNGKRVTWAPHISRDKLQGNMKAFEMVENIQIAGVDQLNPSWTSQEIPLNKDHGLALVVNRVKGREQAWILRVDFSNESHPRLI